MYTQSKFNHFSDFLPTCPADNLGGQSTCPAKFLLSPDKRISAISTPESVKQNWASRLPKTSRVTIE